MKVISGKFKGRLIEINSKNNFRPTLSRIREDLFNLLEHNSKLLFARFIILRVKL